MCLVLDKQARLENVEFQFWTVRLPLQLFTGAGEGMLSLVPPWAPAWTETIDTQQAMQSMQGQAQNLWRRIDKGRGLPLISELCHSQLILLAEHQFKSDSSWLHLQQWLCWTIPWSNLHWAVSVQLGSIPRGSCLSTGCCWAVALQPFV